MSVPAGRLFLVPNTLDLGAAEAPAIADILPASVLQVAARLQHWVVEDAKTTRAFLKRVAAVQPLAQPIQAIDIRELPRPVKGGHGAAPAIDLTDWLAPAARGADIGLLSEAGLPGVADPGAALVAAAHRQGLAVQALPGPSSLMLALAASGLNGQSFAFVGYLPTEARERTERLLALQQTSRRERQTQIAIETPYRNAALMSALLATLHPETRLAVACGLTLPSSWCATRSIAQWRLAPPSFEDKPLPAVFLWLAG